MVASAAMLMAQEAPKNAGEPKLNDGGDYVHRGTGVTFPVKVPGFVRTDVHQFDAAGDDVSASYSVNGFVVTVYSYPVPAPLRNAREVFADAQATIRRANSTARLIREEPARGDGSLRAEYEMMMTRRDSPEHLVRSQLVLFSKDGWLLKYRATYPADAREDGEKQLEAIIRSIGTEALRGGRPGRGVGNGL